MDGPLKDPRAPGLRASTRPSYAATAPCWASTRQYVIAAYAQLGMRVGGREAI